MQKESLPFPENTESLTQASSWLLLKTAPARHPSLLGCELPKDEAGELVLAELNCPTAYGFLVVANNETEEIKDEAAQNACRVRLESRGRCGGGRRMSLPGEPALLTIQLPWFSRIEEVSQRSSESQGNCK